MSDISPRNHFRSQFSKNLVLAGVLIVAALLLRLYFSWISIMNLPTTSDEASSVLLAKMISRGEFPLLFIGQPYQFPLESYLMSFFVEYLPRNALGARYLLIVFGLLSLLGFYLIAREGLASENRWPAVLMIMFPSAYLLLLTVAYAPPQYSMAITLSWLAIYMSLRSRKQPDSVKWPMLVGVTAGLSISNHLLTVSIVAGLFVYMFFDEESNYRVRRYILFCGGFILGVVPYLLAILLIPGAYSGISNTLELSSVLQRILDPVLLETFPGALGVNPVLFPDFSNHIEWPKWLRYIFTVVFIPFFLVISYLRSKRLVSILRKRSFPSLDLLDLSIIICAGSLLLFSFRNSPAGSYRYLLPAVWVFPFLVGCTYEATQGKVKKIIGVAVICITFFNISTSAAMIKVWGNTETIQEYADTPDIQELLNYLYKHEITHCYASFWLAYRITYETNEKILCAMPYNERFTDWPIPYIKDVNKAQNAVYILTQTASSKLTPIVFERQLADLGMDATAQKIGRFRIYKNFTYPPYRGEISLERNLYSINSNAGNTNLSNIDDGSTNTKWLAEVKQNKGQYIDIEFYQPENIASLTLFHIPGKKNGTKRFNVLGRVNTFSGDPNWIELAMNVNQKTERLRFVNNQPIYGTLSQTIMFHPVELKTLRIEIEEPETHAYWGLSDLEIGVLKR